MKPHAVLCLLLFITSVPIAGYGDELMDRIRQAKMERELAAQQAAAGQSHASAVNALPHMLPAPLNRTWHYQGSLYKGTLFKLSADWQKVYVISDWDNYHGSWLNVADLDLETRVSIGVATEEEKAEHAKIKADEEAQEREKEIARVAALDEEKRRLRELAQEEERKLAVRQEILVLLKRQGRLLQAQPVQDPPQQVNVDAPGALDGVPTTPMPIPAIPSVPSVPDLP
ncbi:MAG: hypothetical protein JWR15_3176 [Prosthecobacter sp.]|nr:hypothetical protein [Prosthecobacter sp.]